MLITDFASMVWDKRLAESTWYPIPQQRNCLRFMCTEASEVLDCVVMADEEFIRTNNHKNDISLELLQCGEMAVLALGPLHHYGSSRTMLNEDFAISPTFADELFFMCGDVLSRYNLYGKDITIWRTRTELVIQNVLATIDYPGSTSHDDFDAVWHRECARIEELKAKLNGQRVIS